MTDETLLVRYLVGDLAEDQKARVEEEAFTSDEAFGRLCELEESLASRYLRGELTGEIRAKFEQAYRVSPRRERLLFTAALQRAFPAPVAAEPASPPAWRRWLTIEPLPLRFALAAATITLALGLGWALREANDARLALDNARGGAAIERPEAGAAPRREPVVAAFILSPGLTRGGGREPDLAVPPDADTIRLRLDLESGLTYRSYRAELRTAAGTTAWSGDRLDAAATDVGQAVTVALPAASLAGGDYELILSGLRDDGRFEEAASYHFGITHP
jgi:hypothetical protein